MNIQKPGDYFHTHVYSKIHELVSIHLFRLFDLVHRILTHTIHGFASSLRMSYFMWPCSRVSTIVIEYMNALVPLSFLELKWAWKMRNVSYFIISVFCCLPTSLRCEVFSTVQTSLSTIQDIRRYCNCAMCTCRLDEQSLSIRCTTELYSFLVVKKRQFLRKRSTFLLSAAPTANPEVWKGAKWIA